MTLQKPHSKPVAPPTPSRWGLDGGTIAEFLKRPLVVRHCIVDVATVAAALALSIAATHFLEGTPRKVAFAFRGASEMATAVVVVTYAWRWFEGWVSRRLAWFARRLESNGPSYLFMGCVGGVAFLASARAVLWTGSSFKFVTIFVATLGYIVGVYQLVSAQRRLKAMKSLLYLGWFGPLIYAAEFLVCSLVVFTFVNILAGMEFSDVAAAGTAPHQIAEFYLWHSCSVIPVVDIPETLKWSEPLTYNSHAIGMTVLAFNISVGISIVALIKSHLAARREGITTSSESTGEESHQNRVVGDDLRKTEDPER
jgi:hypothetical protein